MFYATIWALLPPVVAIALALITKEVYSSLFLGIVVGAALVAGFAPVKTLDVIINDGFIAGVADAWNVGIFLFLILLGILVALMNRTGGSAAFGRWAEKHVHTRASPSRSDGSARPMPEQSIFTMMPKPWNGMARHWMRRENTPMRTSSASSSVKSSRMGRAKIPTMSATAEMPATHAIMENRNDSRTRSNRFAPHEKPATG